MSIVNKNSTAKSITKVYKTLLKLESSVRNSGVSTWCDYVPEWQMLVTPILKYDLCQNDSSYNKKEQAIFSKKCLQESLNYFEALRKYFHKNKKVLENLTKLSTVIKKEIKDAKK